MKKNEDKPRQFEIETVEVPVPRGDSPTHLYEVKLLLTAPAGHSMHHVFGAVISWILRGSYGQAEILAAYGGGLKNKTLMSVEGRKAFQSGGRVICMAFDNQPLPKGDSMMLVMREKRTRRRRAKKTAA